MEQMVELPKTTYNLTRKLYSDARRLIYGATVNGKKMLVEKEDLERLAETLRELKNARKED